MTTNPDTATGYAFNDFSKSEQSSGVPSTDPTVLKFQTDLNRFIVNVSPGASNEGRRIGDQASRRAAGAKEKMTQELKSARGENRKGIERQVQRLLSAGKGTQGQRGFEGEIRSRPKSDEVEYIIPKGGKLDITRTGTTDKVEDYGDLEFIPQNTPQTSISRPKVQRPNIGVSAYKGIQLTGPRLSRTHRDAPEAPSYFQLSPDDTNPTDDVPVYRVRNA
jgi:hypothetical protein